MSRHPSRRATEPPPERHELKDIGYEIFVGAVSVLSILNLVLMYVVEDPSLDTVLLVMNVVLTVILFIDFVYRLLTAPSRSDYFFRQFGWADLLASLPVPQLKVLRFFRLVRVFRLLRANGTRVIGNRLMRNRAGSALLTLLLMGILVLEFGSLWILALEQAAPGANITNASDAIWYVVVTISTVGYGDQFPVTNAGRILGAVIIIIGVGIFGTFTGYLANIFLAPKPPREDVEVRRTRERVDHLRELLAEQQATIDQLDKLLADELPGPGS
ncbi:MAG TPA: ion transporter [Ornithinibacter sp.]|nr:ion transporter [Ornithinibacter sp.]